MGITLGSSQSRCRSVRKPTMALTDMQLRPVVEKDLLPYIHLTLPIYNETFLDRTPESHLGKIFALIKLIGDVYSVASPTIWAASYAIWNHMTVVFYIKLGGGEAGFDRVGAIVGDEGPVTELRFGPFRWTRHHMIPFRRR